jgi:signal transduction histidine kinase
MDSDRTGSLRTRLLGLSAITVGVGLALAWLALTILFERHVERRADSELANEVLEIAAALDADGASVELRSELSDPRFQRPFGGLYWQIEQAGAEPLRSRSLWDEALPDPPIQSQLPVSYEGKGPEGRPLTLRAETLRLQGTQGERTVRVIVAADGAEVRDAVAAFGRDLAVALTVIGVCLTLGAALQVGVGLAPLTSLRKGLAEIRARQRVRLDPAVPSEVRPLVEEVNELLAAQDEALARARARAGDLAHGLKTPLTVLSTVSRGLARAGHQEAATEVLAQVEMMRRRVDRQLARARLGADKLATSRLATLVERLVGVLKRTPRGEALRWDLTLSEELVVAADEVDLAEAVGNVLDNACKWARSTVLITASASSEAIALIVEDNGPGVPEARLQEILARGMRLDSEMEGAGLGLAIVRDIVEAYRGALELSRSPLGGLRVSIAWPRAETDIPSGGAPSEGAEG